MQKILLFLEEYAPSVLRYGMVSVILWFSVQQFLYASNFTAYVPDSVATMTHLNTITLVYINAVFELVFGGLLLFGIQTRITALLLSLHLFDIMYVVGYGEIGVRDFGLALATFVIFMNGPDVLCLKDKENQTETTSTQPLQTIKRLIQ